MEHHPYFDLLMHSNLELEELLHASILERITLHEWPLSCVQRITLSGNKTWIYKSQSSPTVEPEFYARTQSPLLIQTRPLFRDTRYACLLLEDLHAPRLDEVIRQESEALAYGYQLLAGIAEIKGSPPVFLDVSSWERWQAVMEGMVEDLNGLVRSGKFEQVNHESLRIILQAAGAPALRAVFDSLPGQASKLVHHDLCAENVFLCDDGPRIIDWQRPIFGPPEIDLVLLMASLGFDPRNHVKPGIVWITDLLRIHWLTECTMCWFPAGVKTYDSTIFHIAQQCI